MQIPDVSGVRAKLVTAGPLPEGDCHCQIIPPVIGMESFAATADSTLGNSSKDLFGLMEIGLL